ncbi:putative transmembrane protein [Vibrio orientalis CIP 102891 = ATCC 33934]|uniref:Permease n=1 Tax=Vibrio orientalis CIP 102891 = ATCC 33934 TaxID=675816 RepID=C9QGD4_VIBOR|nr:DMT family transporter [Vibrio orientalis]EEX94816.1 permease [Vibrio orientalis CIP 102891 = ATCC 33934]EGU53052.1 putative transmembrane protein [Vibrio orientalis CIP 102891 = ATCC 33934]
MPTSLTLPIALIAFAANSFFCRFALSEQSIEPGAFTLIRLLSGALTLVILMKIKGEFRGNFLLSGRSWLAGGALFGYAVAFSFAYTELSTGTGALILFGVVQLTLIAAYIVLGQRLGLWEWLGVMLSVGGFVVLMLPSAQTPDWGMALLMALSGLCWAGFTLAGRYSSDAPSVSITQGFIIASLLALAISPLLLTSQMPQISGVLWAMVSGVLASGFGYILWYQVLQKISVLQASVAQLSVPVIAFAAGGIGLGETITSTSVIASMLVLGGIGLIFVMKRD